MAEPWQVLSQLPHSRSFWAACIPPTPVLAPQPHQSVDKALKADRISSSVAPSSNPRIRSATLRSFIMAEAPCARALLIAQSPSSQRPCSISRCLGTIHPVDASLECSAKCHTGRSHWNRVHGTRPQLLSAYTLCNICEPAAESLGSA